MCQLFRATIWYDDSTNCWCNIRFNRSHGDIRALLTNLVDGNLKPRGSFTEKIFFHKEYPTIYIDYILQKWQIGTVFIPDSVGYFISTNFFATIAHKCGQIYTAAISLAIVGVSCLLVCMHTMHAESDNVIIISWSIIQIPQAQSVISLLLPHFFLGIGIGTLDVALVPLLASIVDTKYNNEDEMTSG